MEHIDIKKLKAEDLIVGKIYCVEAKNKEPGTSGKKIGKVSAVMWKSARFYDLKELPFPALPSGLGEGTINEFYDGAFEFYECDAVNENMKSSAKLRGGKTKRRKTKQRKTRQRK